MERLLPYLEALRDHYGRPRSHGAESGFESIVRAILSPGATPKSLEAALRTMRVFGMIDAGKIRELDPDTIALAIKPAGSASAKAVRLKTFVGWFLDRFGGDLDRLRAIPSHQLREELLEIGGFSPESADALLLLGLGLAVAVVDTHAYRVLTRHELAAEEATYDDLKEQLEKGLPKERKSLEEFRVLTDLVGREFCRPQPRCDRCPLRPLLPAGRGPA